MSLRLVNVWKIRMSYDKKGVMIPNHGVIRITQRRQDNTMARRKKTKGETMVNKILCRQLKIEKHQPHITIYINKGIVEENIYHLTGAIKTSCVAITIPNICISIYRNNKKSLWKSESALSSQFQCIINISIKSNNNKNYRNHNEE